MPGPQGRGHDSRLASPKRSRMNKVAAGIALTVAFGAGEVANRVMPIETVAEPDVVEEKMYERAS